MYRVPDRSHQGPGDGVEGVGSPARPGPGLPNQLAQRNGSTNTIQMFKPGDNRKTRRPRSNLRQCFLRTCDDSFSRCLEGSLSGRETKHAIAPSVKKTEKHLLHS